MAQVTKINVEKVKSVYSGINGKCCCGCSGKHTYAKAHQVSASKSRGYEVSDDEVNDRAVKMICDKIVATGAAELDSNNVSAVVGKRLYVAYFD